SIIELVEGIDAGPASPMILQPFDISDRVAVWSRRVSLVAILFFSGTFASLAGNRFVRFNEVMAGLNGDSTVQFVELCVQTEADKQWGPQGKEQTGRAMLTFHDVTGRQTGRFVFPSDPGPGASTVLIGTAAFAKVSGLLPDFVIPNLVVPIAGQVHFK